jgi:Protein of unknown function (DUF4231)
MTEDMLSPKETGSASSDYNQQLQKKFDSMIDGLEIAPLKKDYLRSRWLDQVLWMEGRANQMRNWHRRLRITAIVASALVPILVTLNFNQDKALDNWLKAGTVLVSGLVTVSATVEEFCQFGNRWYSYRKTVELLKTQGWQFFQLSGTYRQYSSHEEALPWFTDEVEGIIQRDVEVYATDAMQGLKHEEKTLSGNLENKVVEKS